MNFLKYFYHQSCYFLPMQLIKKMGPATTLLPYHHIVSNKSLPHIKHLYSYKTDALFIKDLDFLLKHYNPISVSELIVSVREERKLPSRSFLLSFDDGFREINETIAPILEKKGVPAIFFINPAFIDNKELFYRCKISLLIDELLKNKNNEPYLQQYIEILHLENKSLKSIVHHLKIINQNNAALLDTIADKINFSFDLFLQTQKPFLTSEQLYSLHKKGFSIGAHSLNHPYYPLLSLEEQVNQTISSCKFVNKMLSTKNCCFSFPHSDIELTQNLFKALKQSDIPLLFGIQNQKNEISNNMLHRFNAERPGLDLERQIKGLTLLMWMRQVSGQNNVNRKL